MDETVEENAVRRDVLLAFDYSYLHDDWVTPLEEALDGVSVQEGTWKISRDGRCIWEIVLHMTAWTENIVQRMEERLRGESPGRPPEGDWPSPPATPDEAAWENARQRLWDALSALRRQLEATSLTPMLDFGKAEYSQLADLLCRFNHNAYHIGQITKLRECWDVYGGTV